MRILEVQACSIGYKKPILNDLNFSVEQGEILNVYGENGVGKTTLLKSFLGLCMMKGEIRVFSTNILDLTPMERIRYVSVCFAEVIRSDITVNRYFEISPSNIWKELVEMFEISNLLNKPLRELSSGQNKKVQLVRALSSSAPVISLDEPFTHLDERSKDALKSVLLSLAERGRSIVITSHKPLNFGRSFKLPPTSQ